MNPIRRLHQFSLIVGMFLGSVAMWLGAPAFWLWLAGRSGKVSETSMSSLVMVLIGIPVTMVLIGKLLTLLDHRYTDGFGKRVSGARSPARWLHSLRGGHVEEQPSMLDKVMVVSVTLAMLSVGVWFAFFSKGMAFHG